MSYTLDRGFCTGSKDFKHFSTHPVAVTSRLVYHVSVWARVVCVPGSCQLVAGVCNRISGKFGRSRLMSVVGVAKTEK